MSAPDISDLPVPQMTAPNTPSPAAQATATGAAAASADANNATDISDLPVPQSSLGADLGSGLGTTGSAVGDAAEHYLRAAIAPFAGGIDYLGNMAGDLVASGGDLDASNEAAQEARQKLQTEMVGQPTVGASIVQHINKVADPMLQEVQKRFQQAADNAYATGDIAPGISLGKNSPIAGTAATVETNLLPFLIGGAAGDAMPKYMPAPPLDEVPITPETTLEANPGNTYEGEWTAHDMQTPPKELTHETQTTPSAPVANPGEAAPSSTAPTPEPAGAGKAPVPVLHQADGSYHALKSPNGETLLQEQNNGNLRATRSDTAPAAQGNGEGTARLVAAANLAHGQGGYLESDTSVSPAQAAAYAKLAKQGYVVHQNPDAAVNPTTGNLVSNAYGKPVFTVGPKPMEGMPTAVKVPGVGTVQFGPDPRIRSVAQKYTVSAGLPPAEPPSAYEPITPERGKIIADAYEAMPHNPADPAVASAYDALINETLAQWQHIEGTGLKVEFIKPGQADPYTASPRLAVLDIKHNNHLWTYPTDQGFGSQGADQSAHPMLRPTDITVDGRKLLANDVFRIVHDYFGHAKEGTGFRADGEFNAYRVHRPMYSPLAQQALATETLGQNAWVNFGPKSAENVGASGANTVYADQKAGLLPPEIIAQANGETPEAPQAAARASRFVLPAEEGAQTAEVSPEERAANAQQLKSALPELQEVRTSALSRNYHETGVDFQAGKLTDAVGARAREVMGNEQQAMRHAVARMAPSTESSPAAETQRGRIVQDAIDTAIGHFRRHDLELYTHAKGVAGLAPAQMDTFEKAMAPAPGDEMPPAFLASTEAQNLYKATMAQARVQGLIGRDGKFAAAPADRIEALRQFVSGNWSPRAAGVNAVIKNALDDDLAHSLGENVFKRARANRAVRGDLFEHNDAVAKYLPPEDGIDANRQVQPEHLMGKLLSPATGTQQFASVIRALTGAAGYFRRIGDLGAAKEMEAKTAAALNAIRESLAAGALKAGQKIEHGWDQKSFATYLMDHEQKMALVEKPRTMERWAALNRAGNLLKMDRVYPGAHAQGVNNNTLRQRVANAAEGAVTGMLGPIGGALAEITGASEKAREVLGGDHEMKAVKRYNTRITNLHDLPSAPAPEKRGAYGPGTKQRGGPKFERDTGREKGGGTKAEMMTFRHFSSAEGAPERLNVDPRFYGKGLTGAERVRIKNEGAPLVSSAYAADHPNHLVEPELRGLPEYSIRVPKAKMYDLSADPAKLRARVAEESGGNYGSAEHSEVERQIKAKGYTGYYTPHHDNPLFRGQARFFKPVEGVRVPQRAPLRQGYDPAEAILDAQVRRDVDAAHANPNGARPPLQQGKDAAEPLYEAQARADTNRGVEPQAPAPKAPVRVPRSQRGGSITPAVRLPKALKDATTPEERELFTRKAAQQDLIRAFYEAPSEKEMAATALAGRAKRGWYARAGKAIGNVFGPDAPRFTALLAAMSPQTSVEMNFHNALHTFTAWVKAGRPTDPQAIVRLMQANSLRNPESGARSNVLGAWIPNAIRALTTKNPEHLQISGPKVDSFYQNLRGNVNAVTLDTWMARAANMDPGTFSGLDRKSPDEHSTTFAVKSPGYVGHSARVRGAAQLLTRMTGDQWTPHEVQETRWSWAKTAREEADRQGKGMGDLGPTIPELVKNGDLHDDLIKGTSDFHTLFERPEHRAVLADSEFARGLGRLHDEQEPEPGAPSEAEKAAAASLEKHLHRAAKRLEANRQAGRAQPEEDLTF